ncbi:MAG: carbon-nitrogen hydrolase family protein [Pseudomonadota bacterium]
MKVALLQMTSSDVVERNLDVVVDAVHHAASQGADWLLTPEVTNCLSASRSRQRDVLATEARDITLKTIQQEAKDRRINVLIGSLALKAEGDGAPFVNRSVLVDKTGSITARYDKIHMFDVDISARETYRESAGYQPGDRAVLASVDGARVGLSICYDIRFPGLYRALALGGAKVLTVPAAFSPETGVAHWEALLRARAIETGCYVIAPAQTGTHPTTQGRQRATYGHSMVIDPWGRVIVDAGTEPGVFIADIDLNLVDDCRRRLPSLSHGRDFEGP